MTLNVSPGVQKLSLLAGTLSVASGSQTITANDAFVLGGATVTGNGTINALTTTLVNFNNTIANGFVVNSSGAVTWTDGANLAITGAGSHWTSTGLSFGQTGLSNIALSSGGALSTGTGALVIGASRALVADSSSPISAGKPHQQRRLDHLRHQLPFPLTASSPTAASPPLAERSPDRASSTPAASWA